MNSIRRFVGIDQSKKSFEVCMVTDDESDIKRFKFLTTNEGINSFLKTLRSSDVVGLETGNNAFCLAKHILKRCHCTVHVLNAGALHVIFRSLKKTDKEDALRIAKFLQRHPEKELPTVKIPDDDEMAMRALASHQEAIQKMRTKRINELHCLLWNAGETTPGKNGLKKQSVRQEYTGLLSDAYKKIATRICEAIDLLEQQEKEIINEQQEMLQKRNEEVAISMSMPGVGIQTAFVIAAFLGKMERFDDKRQLGHYSGFTPKVDCSGDQNRYGHITKKGPKQLRRVMNQAAWGAIRSIEGGRFREMYERIKVRRGAKIAIVAVSRKMLELLYVMHTRQELYDGCVDHEKLIKKMRFYGILQKGA